MLSCLLLLSTALVALPQQSRAYQLSFPLSSYREQPSRHELPTSEVLASQEESDRSRFREEPSLASDESPVLLEPFSKRRKGPTLSVVNPLEILRQRLMLDLAQRRIHENQQQIAANAQLLDIIGKRSAA